MSQYLSLERMEIQNANCIAGMTWGFPAITHFLGFVHHTQRELQTSFSLSFGGVMVVCHAHQAHTYQDGGGHRFLQSKNPPYLNDKSKADKTPSIVEEGRMNMTVSLVIKLQQEWTGDSDDQQKLLKRIEGLCRRGRLAGGLILDVEKVELSTARSAEEQRKLMGKFRRRLTPGYVLMERSSLLAKHFDSLQENHSDAQLLNAWMDFSALKYRAELKDSKKKSKPTEKDDAEWIRCDKPHDQGWLVPVMTGYRAISPLYEPGEVQRVRDETVPACFVEAVHTIGEWLSTYRLKDIDTALWHYSFDDGWYLCLQGDGKRHSEDLDHAEEDQDLSYDEVLASI